MKHSKKLILFIICLCAFAGWGMNRFFEKQKDRLPASADVPSLQPQPVHPVCIRFDPSYYYDRQQRPAALAGELTEKWKTAGITHVFFRAYDPTYGAFYKTAYQHNRVGDFGKYDLLKQIIKACRSHDIKVFLWLPVLNHAGAWKANPAWRAKTRSGEDYSAQGFKWPLCAKNTEVITWWKGFVADLLTRYPDIDGVDLAEPIVSWETAKACYCKSCRAAVQGIKAAADIAQIRALSLTELLGETTQLVHKAGKKVSITFVQSASASGELLSPDAMSVMTGFDLNGVLHAQRVKRPDIICPEFLWQQLKDIYADNDAVRIFTPQWIQQAVRQFYGFLDTPVQVIIHIEITDFPRAKVQTDAFKQTLCAALEGGATGIDIYSSNEMDKKNGWAALDGIVGMYPKKRCLVAFDPEGEKTDAIQVGELLRHFETSVTLAPITQYPKQCNLLYDVVFYVGGASDQNIPPEFLNDIRNASLPICWLGSNIESALDDEIVSNRLAMQFEKIEENRFNSVWYQQVELPKKDLWTHVITVLDAEKCQILATATDGNSSVPYAMRSGRNFWYFADVPTSYAVEGGRFLVFADLLHEILDEDHRRQPLAMVRIEDVHPLTDPAALKKIAKFLHAENVPFQIALVPFYVYPENNIHVGIDQKPELVDAIKYSVKKGAAVIMHGVTHQRFGETTADYEFWDPVNDRPPEGETVNTIRKRIEKGLKMLWSVGIYPLMWETPHYAASNTLYSTVKDYFSISMERRQAMDKAGTDQYLPYLIPCDRFGQTLVPENMGYVPLADQDASVILDPAQHMKVVRDGVASFFFHPFIDMDVLKTIVQSMKAQKFDFVGIENLPIRVTMPQAVMVNASGEINFQTGGRNGLEMSLTFPGVVNSKTSVRSMPGGVFSRKVTLAGKKMYAADFMPSSERFDQHPSKITRSTDSIFKSASNFKGEKCQVPRPMVIETAQNEKECDAFEALFDLAGICVTRQGVSDFSTIYPECNIIVLPQHSAEMLDENQVRSIISALRNGRISLMASGFSGVSDELGIQRRSDSFAAQSIKDNFYPDMAIECNSPTYMTAYEAPADADYIYEDRATGAPLMVSASLGKGRYLFFASPVLASTAPADEVLEDGISKDIPHTGALEENNDHTDSASKEAFGCRLYPYLLQHIWRSFQLFPLIRSAKGEIYFNPAERGEDVSIETLVKQWRRSGVRTIYAAAWHVFPEWMYDYKRLIHLAHTNGMLVNAWFEWPYVNEKFWVDHPEWREKNVFGQDVCIGWRKPMALENPDCFKAVSKELAEMLRTFDWDGVVMNRSGWEIDAGINDLKTYTPFHPSFCQNFQSAFGYDPRDIFLDASSRSGGREIDRKIDTVALDQYNRFRNVSAKKWLTDIIKLVTDINVSKGDNWEIILTFDDGRSHSGLSLDDMVELKTAFDLLLQLKTRLSHQWEPYSAPFDLIQLVFESVPSGRPFYANASTVYPTGTAMYGLIRGMIRQNQRCSIYSESSLYEIDKEMLPFVFAPGSNTVGDDARLHVIIPFSSEMGPINAENNLMMIDGKSWAGFADYHMILPAGEYDVSPVSDVGNMSLVLKSGARIVDCSADLLYTDITTGGLKFEYDTNRRAVAVINQLPISVNIDGVNTSIAAEKGLQGWALSLPKGHHSVMIQTQTELAFVLKLLSLVLSNSIVLITGVAIFALSVIGIMTFYRSV